MAEQPLSGRRAQARRNDRRILEAARAVFVADASAPVSAVAEAAGVGMSALYRRYGSKEDLLRALCSDGLQRYIAEVEAALADEGDERTVFADFMRRVVDADTHTLTQRLAGSFVPSEELYAAARRAEELNLRLIERCQAAGALRADVTAVDISVVFEMVAAVRVGDADRTTRLRHRYLGLLLDGLRGETTDLPEAAPDAAELGARWNPATARRS
jgi:AcrR family transcriptional regulator